MGCGGGKHNTPPSHALEAAVRAAAIAGVSGFEPNGRCVQSLSSGLIHRVYGSVSRCKRVVGDSAASPNFGVNVIAEKVTGQRALVRVVAKNGDDPNVVGTVALHYERAAWRIDDFDAQYLRSGLGKAVAGQAEVVDPVLEADIGTCIDRRFRRVGDAEIKRVAYGVLGERHR